MIDAAKQQIEKLKQIEILAGCEVKILKRNSDYVATVSGQIWSMKGRSVRRLRPFRTKPGLLAVTLSHHGIRVDVGLAKLIAETFLAGAGTIVYKDGNSGNCSVENLRYGTASERQQIIHRAGRMPVPDLHGEDRAHVKLTNEKVLEIRRRASQGEKQISLAREFDVSRDLISRIVRRKVWRHI